MGTRHSGEEIEKTLPRIKVDRVVALAGEFGRSFLRRYTTQPVTEEGAQHLALQFVELADRPFAYRGVHQTLRQLVGHPVTLPQAARLGWQIAGRLDDLEAGPVPLFESPVANEWVALEIQGVGAARWPDGRPAVDLTLFPLTGTPAGFQFVRRVPEGWLRFLAYQIGYSRRVEYPDEPRYLVGLRFWAWTVSGEEGLDMSKWAMDPAIAKANRLILRLRHRFDTTYETECPRDLDIDCWDCTSSLNECPAAYRRYAGQPPGDAPGARNLNPDPGAGPTDTGRGTPEGEAAQPPHP